MVKHITQCPKGLQSKNMRLAIAGGGRGFGSRETHVWHAREGYGGADAVQSPKSVDWDLTQDSRYLSSYEMTCMLKNIANQWQILVHFSSFATSICPGFPYPKCYFDMPN